MILIYILFLTRTGVLSFSTSLRGYSVIWRNNNNEIVKKVVYTNKSVFTEKLKNEDQVLNDLPNGFEYEIFQLSHVNKLACKIIRKL